MNIPETELKNVAFTKKDKADAEFAIKKGVDYIACSFVQTAEDLDSLRDLLKREKLWII